MKSVRVNIPFLVSIVILVIAGYLIFVSASMGLLTKQANVYAGVAFNQTFFGLFLGIIACIITAKIDYKLYKKFALPIFILSVLATLLVFVPHISGAHGGARRWIYISSFSIEPSEFLKIGFIIFLSAWISNVKTKVETFKHGFLPFLVLIGIAGAVLLKQPDTTTFLIIALAGVGIYLSGGGKWKNILILFLIGLLGLGVMAFVRPYAMSRITTFLHPSDNAQSSGYQIQQSLIAVGSGGVFGRGFGQSVQKFNFLPEPIGDSIFAVAGEEFGFVGATGLIILFVFFAFAGLKIADKTPDQFGRLLALGIVILIVSQAFVNIGAMIGILPLAGVPLPFVSHGGTALFMNLAEVGIVLNISKQKKKA